MAFRIPITEDEYFKHLDKHDGFCLPCGDWTTDSVEPDGRDYKCVTCGERRVFGAKEILLMGFVYIPTRTDR